MRRWPQIDRANISWSLVKTGEYGYIVPINNTSDENSW